MKHFCKLLSGVAMLSFVVAHPALAEVKLGNGTLLQEKPYFIVTYIEAAPSGAKKAAELIKKHSAASKQQFVINPLSGSLYDEQLYASID